MLLMWPTPLSTTLRARGIRWAISSAMSWKSATVAIPDHHPALATRNLRAHLPCAVAASARCPRPRWQKCPSRIVGDHLLQARHDRRLLAGRVEESMLEPEASWQLRCRSCRRQTPCRAKARGSSRAGPTCRYRRGSSCAQARGTVARARPPRARQRKTHDMRALDAEVRQ